jgi:hypothetical protein
MNTNPGRATNKKTKMNQNPLSAKEQNKPKGKKQPSPYLPIGLRTGLQYLFYKPEREVSASHSIKLYKSMKNLILIAMTAVALTIFNGCQKVELESDLTTKKE